MSGGSASSSEYWPGFVDALTNVVIAMIFVIVVIAIALSFAMQLIVKKAADQVSEARAQTAQAQAQAHQQAGLEGGILIHSNAPDHLRDHQGITLHHEDEILTIVFDSHSVLVDAGARAKLASAAQPVAKSLGAHPGETKVKLVARGPSMHFTDNQRAAYIRLISVRNVLMAAGIPAGSIAIQIDRDGEVRDDLVAVSLAGG